MIKINANTLVKQNYTFLIKKNIVLFMSKPRKTLVNIYAVMLIY